jgi:hypothetical protein
MYFQLKGARRQRTFTIFENVYLVRARSVVEARKKARGHARWAASVEDAITVNGVSAKTMFAGLRKVVLCAGDPQTSKPDRVHRVYDGIEATYSRYRVVGRDRLNALVRGQPVSVKYEE